MPDYGSGRCDFPGGDPLTLHASVQRLFALPDGTRLLAGHDYAPNGRSYRCAASVKEQREHNLHLKAGTTAEAFAEMRAARDATLDPPKLMRAAVPFNLVGGTVRAGTLSCSAPGIAA
jgi:glyoxylase-like metal-dependent hydrolase (beta-lactamase superfamily II)